ncbi:MAG TPA: hypothetical protein VH476_01535 [Solirubrobacterales bacterium]
MTGSEENDALRLDELERVNAELAAEIRNLTLGRAAAPRTTALGAGRRIQTLTEERDAAVAELEQQSSELRGLRAENEELSHRAERQIRELDRLRAGPLGLLRRAKAGYLRRRPSRDGGA